MQVWRQLLVKRVVFFVGDTHTNPSYLHPRYTSRTGDSAYTVLPCTAVRTSPQGRYCPRVASARCKALILRMVSIVSRCGTMRCGKYEERRPTRCNNWTFIIYFCLNMFRASLCLSLGEQRPCYCIWCVVLVLLDVVGSGCGALSCRNCWILLVFISSYFAHDARSQEPKTMLKKNCQHNSLLKSNITTTDITCGFIC